MSNTTKFQDNWTDWTIINWEKLLKPQFNYNDLKHTYRQSEVSKSSCSIHWILWVLANNFNKTISLWQRKDIWAEAIKRGASEEWWWRFHKAIKLVQEYFSENKDLDFKYFTVPTSEILPYLDKWFSVYWGVKIKEWYNADKLADWFLWDVESYWEDRFWHAIFFQKFSDWNYWYVDNYFDERTNKSKTKYNEVRFRDFNDLLEKWIFFNTCYICIPEEEIVRNWYNFLTLEEKQKKLSERPEVIAKKEEIAKKNS